MTTRRQSRSAIERALARQDAAALREQTAKAIEHFMRRLVSIERQARTLLHEIETLPLHAERDFARARVPHPDLSAPRPSSTNSQTPEE